MAAVEGGGAAPSRSQAVADLQAAQNVQAVKLLDLLEAAKPVNLDGFIPGYGMPGGADIPKSTGLYAAALADDVWPTDSPSGLRNTASRLEELARMHKSAAETAKAQSDHVFAASWTAGDGADAAYTHYQKQHLAHLRLAQTFATGAAGVRRLAEDAGNAQRKMHESVDEAHRQIEVLLQNSKSGLPVSVGLILTKHRTDIIGFATDFYRCLTTKQACSVTRSRSHKLRRGRVVVDKVQGGATSGAPGRILLMQLLQQMAVPGSAGRGGGDMAATSLTPYGSVLPPAATSAAPATGGGPASVSSVLPTGGGGGPGAGPGFVPTAVRDGGPARVNRDVSMTDLELARTTVADLVAASSVVYPGLDWAVAIARGASGLPEIWIATDEGAGYIPVGVYLLRTAPLAAGLDPDFDARWFGWFNPGETVQRAIRARGDAVSAIATTWVSRSELIDDAVEDVALGVTPAGAPADADASHLIHGRSHRLEPVDPALFVELEKADAAVVDDYCRELKTLVQLITVPRLAGR